LLRDHPAEIFVPEFDADRLKPPGRGWHLSPSRRRNPRV
jgi:hypothetical protein